MAMDELRKTGITVIGDVPMGTHFCQFYQTKEDLLDILVPYFKAGLEHNEFCMWVSSEPLAVDEATNSLKGAVPDLDNYLERGQIEILDYSEWYTKSGWFESEKVLHGWIDKERQALKKGFDGLRLTGNTFWLEKRDWDAFTEYEATVDGVIGNYQMLAICSYSLDKCRAQEIIDVVSNHRFALIRRKGKWERIESAKRRWIEEELQDSERKYRLLVENLNEGIWTIDRDANTTYVNPRMAEMLGYTRAEMHGKHLFTFMDERGVEIAQRNLERRKQGIKEQFDFELLRKDGTKLYAVLETSPITDNGGNYIGAIAGVMDNTDRRQMEIDLRASKQRLADIIEFLPDATFALDREGILIAWNRAMEELTGFQAQDMIGKGDYEYTLPFYGARRPGLADLVNNPDDEELEKKYTSFKREGNTLIAEAHFPAFRGEEVYFWAKAASLYDLDGNVSGAIEVIRDITDRKRAEDDLQRSYEDILQRQEAILNLTEDLKNEIEVRKMAEERTKAALAEKELLLREIHHRVKNNMQIVYSLLYLQSEFVTDNRALTLLKESQNRIRSMATIHDRLYRSEDLAKIDFADYTRQLADGLIVSYGFDTALITLKIDVDAYLSLDTAIPCGLIINELVTNSLKHAFPKGRKGEISVALHPSDTKGRYILSIRDNGIGFPKDMDLRNTKSLGLGLVYELVNQLEGSIELDRREGTAFTITFVELKYKKRM